MWLSIIGSGGSAKNVVADILAKDGFEDLRKPFVPANDLFVSELRTAHERLRLQFKAADLMDRRDVVTVRNYWDSVAVYFPLRYKQLEINSYEKDVFDVTAASLLTDVRVLKPPHAVIYMKTTQMAASDRLKLRGIEPNQDQLKYEISAYEEMVSRIRVPVLELDGTKSPEVIRNELDFHIASFKTSNLSGSLWQREFYR